MTGAGMSGVFGFLSMSKSFDAGDADVMRGGEIERQIADRDVAGCIGIPRIEELRYDRAPRYPVARIAPRLVELNFVVQVLMPHVRQEASHPADALARLAISD